MRYRRLAIAAAFYASFYTPALAQANWLHAMGVDPGAPILVLPAAAGPVIDVGQRLTSDRFAQTVVLQGDTYTPGRNTIVATIVRGAQAPAVTDQDVESEMADVLPGFDMRSSSYPGHNGFGVFGYAQGSKGGVACLYAWQALDIADRWITGRRVGMLSESHALTWRVRLCRSNIPPRVMVDLVQHIARARLPAGMAAATLYSRANPYGIIPASSTFVSSFSAPTPILEDRPVQASASVAALLAPAPPAPRRMMHRARWTRPAATSRPVVLRPAEPAEPLTGMPVVPMPQ